MSTVQKYLPTPPFGVKLILSDQTYDREKTVNNILAKSGLPYFYLKDEKLIF